MNRLLTALVAAGGVAATASVVHANVEIGGTAGIHTFSTKNELGVDDAPGADSERNSSLFGVRLGLYFHDIVGVEGEFGFIPTESRQGVFDVWDITYRGHLVLQARARNPENKLIPFVLGGGGAMQIIHSQNTNVLAHDTDAELYFGVGLKYRVDNGWGLRIDGRMLFPPSSANKSVTEDFEVLLSIYREWGRKEVHKPVGPRDSDGDGITDDVDKCPMSAEDKDGYQDADGCPDPDNDGDGIPDSADKCPNDPEDKDGFQDADGCPDPDNDGDGIPDAQDKCPNQPETKNGYQDADGCPDEIPARLKQFTGAIQGINFKTSSADILPSSHVVLDKAVAVLKEFSDLHMEIQGHTDDVKFIKRKGDKFEDNMQLSQARAESVMSYLVSKGIDQSRLTAKGYGHTVPLEDPTNLKGAKLNAARTKNRRVEFRLITQTK